MWGWVNKKEKKERKNIKLRERTKGVSINGVELKEVRERERKCALCF